jgi:serine/threonine protein phosphatase PrpC
MDRNNRNTVTKKWNALTKDQERQVLEAGSGSCALVVYIDKEKIVTATTGDSWAVREYRFLFNGADTMSYQPLSFPLQ